MNTVIVENCKTLFIGRRGENEVTKVVFDFAEWQEQFGAGVIDLYVKRNLDVDAYPVLLSVDGTVATWLVTAADTDVVGNGKIEFVYTVDQKVAKSAVFPFFVGEDIGESSPEPPEHYQSWLEQLTELGAETQANAQAAAQSANDAAESVVSAAEEVDKARLFVEDAEAWAVGERGGEPVSEGDETYENNAKYWAENARTSAPVQSVNGEIGDVELTLDDVPNGESFVRTTPEQLAQITTNAGGISDINAKIPTGASSSNQLADKSYISNYYLTKAAQSATDAAQNVRINNINAVIPSTASAQNQLVDQNSLDSKLSNYRTASQQNLIDNNKQTKITANGILKGNGLGGISAAVAGMDYLPTSALYAYRSANAQDAIDNAQNENINKNTAALTTMQPAATAADIGKALIVKTVADGKPTSYEYGEAGGGGSALTAGDGLEISNDVISNTQGIEYIVGTQTAATSKWTGVSTDETLKVGKIIAYYLPYAGTSTAATLALTMADGTTTREISLQLKPNATVTTQFPAGSIIILVYDGSYWRVNASYDTDTNTNPTGYCLTNGSVAAKTAVCSFGYRGDTNYFPCLFRFANTATDATLAITTYAPEAAPIYVNGQRTSTTNTFSAGVILFLYYNGAYYCYNDGRFPILVDGAVTSVQEYAAGLSNSKQSIISASGILKGDGAGGVSSAVAGVDYLQSAPVTSVNGQTGDVTVQVATDAQVTTAVNTWLGENVAQETGYVLDASLTMSNAAPPASAVGELKSAVTQITSDLVLTADATSSGWRLNQSNGLCSRNSGYTLLKFKVQAGKIYEIVSDDRFQFQTSPSVPSYGTNTNIIGSTYQDGTYLLLAPDTATDLIVSTPTESNASVTLKNITKITYDNAEQLKDAVFRERVEPTSTANNWALMATGLSASKTGWKMIKYPVKAGNLIYIKTPNPIYNGASYQFQTNSSVGSTQNPYLVGEPVLTPADNVVSVPETATWLIISALIDDNNSGIYQIPEVIQMERDLDAIINSNIVNENKDATNKILASRWLRSATETPLTLLWFSDIHRNKTNLERIIEYRDYLKSISAVDDTIVTGDLVQGASSEASSATYFDDFWYNTPGTEDILVAIGNHEWYAQGASPHGKITLSQANELFFDDFNNWGAVRESNYPFYYKDYASQGIRLIVTDPAIEAEADETTWLRTTLADARANGLSVVIASHYLMLNSSKEIQSATIIDNDWTNNVTRQDQTMTMNYDWTGSCDIVKCVSDFISDGGSFLCYIIGHWHWDFLCYPTGHPDQLIISIASATDDRSQTKLTTNDLPRYANTRTQDAFNVITFDAENKTVKCVRVGANMNMDEQPRTAFVYDVSSHTFISVI